ncbi:Uncharacterized protein Fot_24767 [Forsythia ovata]|uniref:Uncharacterized protein n=1 Tax=Forsythia ovata TaxID=205694 RepID=A0ABD1U739_9LAMI
MDNGPHFDKGHEVDDNYQPNTAVQYCGGNCALYSKINFNLNKTTSPAKAPPVKAYLLPSNEVVINEPSGCLPALPILKEFFGKEQASVKAFGVQSLTKRQASARSSAFSFSAHEKRGSEGDVVRSLAKRQKTSLGSSWQTF